MKEELRKEFYTVMEQKEPFGNEYHHELFEWMWSKFERLREENERLKAAEYLNQMIQLIVTSPYVEFGGPSNYDNLITKLKSL